MSHKGAAPRQGAKRMAATIRAERISDCRNYARELSTMVAYLQTVEPPQGWNWGHAEDAGLLLDELASAWETARQMCGIPGTFSDDADAFQQAEKRRNVAAFVAGHQIKTNTTNG